MIGFTMGFINNNRNQIDLLGYSLNDFVPKNAKCCFVVNLIKQLDLSNLYERYSNQGNDAYEPSAMLATWFYGYCEGVFTTRKLEERCCRDVYYMYVSSNLRPDHSSLSRFRKNNKNLMNGYFVQIIRLAWEQGLSDFKEIAIDGSKIQASSSANHLKNAEELEKALKRVRADIDDYMKKAELLDDDDDDINNLPKLRHKIKELRKMEKELAKNQRLLNKRRQKIKPDYRTRHKINCAEADCRVMDKVNGRQKLPAYNAQLSVDTASQLIVANEAVSDSVDFNQFKRQREHVEHNLGVGKQRSYVADAGYHNLDQLEDIYSNNVDAILASPTNPQHLTNKPTKYFNPQLFIYNGDDDYYLCPNGEKLTYTNNYNKSDRWHGRIYSSTACVQCTLKSKCISPKATSRNIRRENRQHYAEKMLQQSCSVEGRARLKRRFINSESVFGNLKHNLGFRRFYMKGLNAVNAELNLLCIAHNINKLFKLGLIFSNCYSRSINNIWHSFQRTILIMQKPFWAFSF